MDPEFSAPVLWPNLRSRKLRCCLVGLGWVSMCCVLVMRVVSWLSLLLMLSPDSRSISLRLRWFGLSGRLRLVTWFLRCACVVAWTLGS